MLHRAWILARAQLAGEWLGEKAERLPVAPLLFLASLSALLCALARDALEPYGYGVYALTVMLALVALPLLGELGPLLRADVAAEWVGAQPVRPLELRLGRVLVIAVMLGGLASACLLPAALLAPGSVELSGKLWLILGGLGLTALLAATLLWLQALFGERAEGLLVLIQAGLLALVMVGLFVGTGQVTALRGVEAPSGALLALPPAWFALPLSALPMDEWGPGAWLASVGTLLALVTFAVAPFPPRPRSRSTRNALGLLLTPLRRLAGRCWVRPTERAAFEFVYDALPAERDFVVRTYPLVAAPLAFLLLGADPDTREGQGLYAILLFAPATYLPFLLLFVPCSATPAARHLLDTAPLRRVDEDQGALKAVAVRFLCPLMVALVLLVWSQAGAQFALRLAAPATIAMLVMLRVLWPTYVQSPPLSVAPGDLGSAWQNDLTGGMFGVGLVATLLALGSWAFVPSPAIGLALGLVYLGIELTFGRRERPDRAPSAAPAQIE